MGFKVQGMEASDIVMPLEWQLERNRDGEVLVALDPECEGLMRRACSAELTRHRGFACFGTTSWAMPQASANQALYQCGVEE